MTFKDAFLNYLDLCEVEENTNGVTFSASPNGIVISGYGNGKSYILVAKGDQQSYQDFVDRVKSYTKIHLPSDGLWIELDIISVSYHNTSRRKSLKLKWINSPSAHSKISFMAHISNFLGVPVSPF